MDERDLKMANLRAQIDGQQKTIEEQAAEITRLRKRDTEITQAYEEIRDRYTQLMGDIMDLMDRLKA